MSCSLSGGVTFVAEDGGAVEGQGRAAKQQDMMQKHGAAMMLALAGAQTVARAYMNIRRSLPKVIVHPASSDWVARGHTCISGVVVSPSACVRHTMHFRHGHPDLQLPVTATQLPG